jgi:two-component system, OmpR family, sensor kinase
MRSWSLRTRLLAELLVLLAFVCVIIGGVIEIALNRFLLGQLDSRVNTANMRVNPPPRPAPRPGDGQPPPPGDGQPPPGDGQPPPGDGQPPPRDGQPPPGEGQPPPDGGREGKGPHGPGGGPPRPPKDLRDPGNEIDTLLVYVVNGTLIRAETLDGSANPPEPKQVPTEASGLLQSLPVDGHPRTVNLGALGDYRVIAVKDRQGNADSITVSGLPMRDVYAIQMRLMWVVIGVAGFGLVLAGVIGAPIVRITLRPMSRMADAASQVATLTLDRGEVALPTLVPDQDTDLRTEVGKVGNAMNRMLEHIGAALAARQASENQVRQFVADASHELRTPLAAIRGYAELTRRDRGAVPDAVAYALQRVESESQRMSTLVDDLLLLARLDAGRPLAKEPVDLSRLVVDTTSDAHAAGLQHHWQLELPEESIMVIGDESQLHHVLGNLLANARVHTPPGTKVEVRLATENGDAVITVSDDGPGIPSDRLPQIFDRFVRGDVSRFRAAGTGSTGLGLAIAAAVVEAHHGTIEPYSVPGRTTFTVRLPLNGHTAVDAAAPSASAM